MAKVLQLYDGSSYVDMLAGDLEIEESGLTLNTSRERKVWETINLVSGSGDSAIRTAQAKIDEFVEKARLYEENPIKSTPIWWYWQSEGESAKRAVVFDGLSSLIDRSPFNTALLGRGAVLRLALQRYKSWENATSTPKSGSSLSTLGGVKDVGDVGGTSPARIARMYLVTSLPDTITRYWIGIKPVHAGLQYEPLWELEDGTMGTSASVVGDGTASGGNKVQVSFAYPGLVERVNITPGDVTLTNYPDFTGRYSVLLRCKVDAGATEVGIQLRQGWRGQIAQTETIVGTQYISGQTEWKLVELGEIQIPVTGNRDSRATGGAGTIASNSLSIWAERISGSGTLDMDCIGLCPSEHMVKAFYGGVMPDLGGPIFFTSPIDEQYAVADIAGEWGNVQDPSFDDWFYPVGGGRLVVFGEDNTSHKLGKTVDVYMDLYPRWKSYRT